MPGPPERWELGHSFSHQGLGRASTWMQLFPPFLVRGVAPGSSRGAAQSHSGPSPRTAAAAAAAAALDGAASFGLGGWFARVSTDPAPALCFQMNMQPRFQLNYQKHLSFLTDATTGMEKEVS